MNLYELRNSIMVYMYGPERNGSSTNAIHYSINAVYRNIIHLEYTELISELIKLGSLGDNVEIKEETILNYHLSQWDALNIAIRFELAREQEKEIDKWDIFKAIADIIKPTK